MAESTKQFWRDVFKSVIAPLVVGLIVGMASAYLTVREVAKQANSNTDRITTVEMSHDKDVSELAKAIHGNKELAGNAQQETSERLIRLETKIDLLLDGKLKDR